MTSDSINEEARIGDERLLEQAAEIIQGCIGELTGTGQHVVALDASATVCDAVRSMIENRVGVVLIVDGERLAGLFSERDVLTRVIAHHLNPVETPVTDVMTESPECLSADAEIVYALNRMTVGGFRHIPIVDNEGRPQAVLSMRDVVQHIVSFYPNEIFNLPANPDANISRQREGA